MSVVFKRVCLTDEGGKAADGGLMAQDAHVNCPRARTAALLVSFEVTGAKVGNIILRRNVGDFYLNNFYKEIIKTCFTIENKWFSVKL